MTKLMLILAVILLTGCQPGACKSTPPPSPGEAGVTRDAPPDVEAPPADAAETDARALSDAEGHQGGSFAVGIQTGPGLNCGPVGAGISEFRVSLGDSSGSCIPAQFSLVGGTPIPDQRSACPSTPAVFPCFEVATKVSASDLTPGGYHLVVEGVVSGRVCWKGDASLGVSDTPDEHTLTLLKQEGC